MALKFTKLTRTNVRNLQAGQSVCEHGIVFERLVNGDGRYVVNVMIDGQRVHRVVGKESDGVTRQQVEGLIEKFKTDARQGRLNLPKGRKVGLGFADAATKYLKQLEKINGKDLKTKKFRLELHLIPYFKNKTLTTISTLDVEAYKKHRKDEKAKDSTINRELAVLSHLLNRAIEWEWVDYKRCTIKKFKEELTRITYLTKEQIGSVLKVAKLDSNAYIYLFLKISLGTSMRKMEVLSIAIKDIDFKTNVIFIPKSKTGARHAYMTTDVANFLKEYITNSTSPNQIWLFPSEKSATGHAVNIDKTFRRVIKNAGLDPKEVVRHTTRHTAITLLANSGASLPTVQKFSGHKSIQMVMRYTHHSDKHFKAAMDVLDEELFG
jgi:integrase